MAWQAQRNTTIELRRLRGRNELHFAQGGGVWCAIATFVCEWASARSARRMAKRHVPGRALRFFAIYEARL